MMMIIIIISLIFLNLSRLSHGKDDERYLKCLNPFKCGEDGENISYPFWGGNRPSDCGLEGFELTCHNDDYITINIGAGQGFRVLYIDQSSLAIRIARGHEYYSNVTCQKELNDTKLNEAFFYYNQSSTDVIHLFDDCPPGKEVPPQIKLPPPIDQSRNNFTCMRKWIPSNLFRNEEPYQLQKLKSCKTKISVPVNTTFLEEFRRNESMQLEELVNQSFLVCYKFDGQEACSKCADSGGSCWSINGSTQPTCICRDGPHPSRCPGKNNHLGLKIGIGFGAAGFGIVSSLLAFCIYNRRKKTVDGSSLISRNVSSYPSSMSDFEKGGTYMGVPIFTYNELEKATNNFDSNKELGDGGFGTVYKGKLQDGRVVAVKRLYENNFKRVEQFMNEIEILTRLRHQNLVSLYGCTSQHCRQLLLVYEYIPNGTVADHLHGEHAKPGVPTWKTRMRIAIETANALSYLHASDVIHRDVKTTNILLDNNFCVKVADFGLSRLFPLNVTHISTSPQGTPGYVDPEYHECYQLTNKSDVYSFGVVLIELISSKPAVDISRHRHEINLSNMAINKIQTGALHELVDLSLGFESDYEVRKMITEVAELAFQCLQSGREFRPSMQEVLKGLKRIQSKYYDNKSHVEADLLADDASMLKNNPQILSPDSVTVKWASNSNSTMSGSSS